MNIVYKEWLPDQPNLGKDGLATATNVIPSVSGYKPFHPLDTSMKTLGATPFSAFVSAGIIKTENNVYAWDQTNLYVGGASSFATIGASTANTSGDYGSFAQYGNLVIFAGGATPKKHAVGSGSNFSTLAASGTAPPGSVIGVIGQFVLIGNIWDAVTANRAPFGLQWCGIDNPTSWPTPNSATAIAQQAGYQEMDFRYGRVTGIHGGDQYGVVLQDTAVTRVTYVGPPAVFQFDNIANNIGSRYPNRSVQAGHWTYFLSMLGFCRTNGVDIERIGAGKVDDYFASRNVGTDIQVSYDPLNKNVMFAYASSGGPTTLNSLLVFNEETSHWSNCDTNLSYLLTPSGGTDDGNVTRTAMAFNSGSSGILGKFQATAGSAILETGEMEFNEAGRTYLDSWKPLVESTGTAPAITGRIGYRDDQQTAVSYTSTTSAFARTGVMNTRVDAKYMRIETQIVGNFTKATGVELDPQPSSMA